MSEVFILNVGKAANKVLFNITLIYYSAFGNDDHVGLCVGSEGGLFGGLRFLDRLNFFPCRPCCRLRITPLNPSIVLYSNDFLKVQLIGGGVGFLFCLFVFF